MQKIDFEQLNMRLCAISVFSDVANNKVLCSLKKLLSCVETTQKVVSYAEFCSQLYATGEVCFGELIKRAVFASENIFVKLKSLNKPVDRQILQTTDSELDTLQTLANLSFDQLKEFVGDFDFLPRFSSCTIDLKSEYYHRCENADKYGFGKFAQSPMFFVENGKILPVISPDKVCLADFVGYELNRKIIIENTQNLIEGRAFLNVLLTGDAGTGKSSTVKAIVNEYYDQGLRLIEVKKSQIDQIPMVLDSLSQNPLKFILFIDDISFESGDDDFNALKALLEGSATARANNVAIYATSNRRHIIKESFADRQGDDVHFNDTMQEIISLSERFGIHVYFEKPNKTEFLNIVYGLLQRDGVAFDKQDVAVRAERYALDRGGRSARLAKQFVCLVKNDRRVL